MEVLRQMCACVWLCRYEGSFVRGKREGSGKYYYANGDSYEGQFKVHPQNHMGFLSKNGSHF